MKRVIVLTVLFVALSVGQIHRLSSSYKNGVKWKFGANISHGDILARSNVDQVPMASNYKSQPIMPIIRKEPVETMIYEKTSVPDVYQKSALPTVFKHEPVVYNIRKQQSAVFKTHSVVSNIYKSESVVQNVYKQQAAVPIVHKKHSIVPNIYRNQAIREPVAHHQQSLHHFVVSGILPVDSKEKLEHHIFDYQYDPYHLTACDNVRAVLRN